MVCGARSNLVVLLPTPGGRRWTHGAAWGSPGLPYKAYSDASGNCENLSAYDAGYVALAEALDCSLVTADARISRAPGVRCPITVVPR